MSTGMTLFIGGPGHPVHERMATTALSDPALRSTFRDAQAYDDDRAKSATVDTADWRSYLRRSDVGVFLLPHNRSGSRSPDGKFYTELEIEQAYRSGIFLYLLVERGGGNESELVAAVRRIFRDDFQFVACRKPFEDIVVKFKDCLLDAIRRSDALRLQILRDLADISGIAGTSGKVQDATLASTKAKALTSDGALIRQYGAACWNLRRNHPQEPMLASYLLRGLMYVLRPCMGIDEIAKVAGGGETELLQRIEWVTTASEDSRMARLSDEVFASLSDWRQREIVWLLREISVFFRYRLYFARDWRCAKRAIELSRKLAASGDPVKEDLFDLAVGVVPSAAYALRIGELTDVDPENSLAGVLEERHHRDSNPGAAMALAVYWASRSDWSRARGLLQTARDQLRSAGAKLDAYVHASIVAACIETDNERRQRFRTLQNEVPAWPDRAHPMFRALATEASRDYTAEWTALLQRIKREDGP